MCKNIEEMLSSIDDKSKKTWILLDTETTGLKGYEKEQLTQIAGKSCKYNLINNTFKDFNVFNKKIKLNENSIKRLKDENDKISWVLDFNGYEKGNHVYYEEKLVIGDLLTFCNTHFPCMLMAQNSDFDMDMLNGRSEYKFTQEVFDTKFLIQMYYIPILQKLSENDNYYKNLIKKIGTSERDNGLISSSLSKIGPVLGIDMSGYHDALVDCDLMKKMFIGIVKIMKENKSLDIKKYQLERLETKS